MSQYDFDQLLQKYLAGNCDPDEEKLILVWYQDMISPSDHPIGNQEKEALRQRIWQKLATNTTPKAAARRSLPLHPDPQITIRRHPFRAYTLAFATLLLLTLAGLWYDRTMMPSTETTDFTAISGSVERQNSSLAPQPIRLEDGSLVTLKPGASLHYPAHFGLHNRVVSLKGEAFFTVRKDLNRPFIVYTGALVTEVLGTSFSIRADKGSKAIEVAVMTGRVSVYQATDGVDGRNREVILKPNERITYTTYSQQLIPSLVEQPIRIVPPKQSAQLLFDGTPLPTVLAQIQAVYGIDIYLESDGLTNCVLNADLNDLSLREQLELVCRSVDAQYEVRGTSIFIRGNGCP